MERLWLVHWKLHETDLRVLLGDAIVVLCLYDPDGAITRSTSTQAFEDGTPLYDDALQVIWEQSDNGVTWEAAEGFAETHRLQNLIAIMDYNDPAQVQLAEQGYHLVAGMFPARGIDGKMVRARILSYYDKLDPVVGTSVELHDLFGAPSAPNPAIVSNELLIPVGSFGGLEAELKDQEPTGGFRANNGNSVQLKISQTEKDKLNERVQSARIVVVRYNDAAFTQVDETFDDTRGQITSFPPVSYVFQSDSNDFPGISDVGKYFEFSLIYSVGPYYFESEPLRLVYPVRG